jgi:HAMP domain-containing protein
MTEEYGHIPDGFLLNPEEIEELRKSKRELTEYGKKKLQELMNKEAERKALETLDKLYDENGDALKRLAEIEALEIAREDMVEYDEALKKLAKND